jgi:alkylation response protein AidB-like acyl-CoA dehydrogenase
MKSPGVTVRPIITIDDCEHVNEVFFDNVRVPAENLVGELNHGWTYAKFLLGNERHSNALIQRIKREISKLRELAADKSYGMAFMAKPSFRRKLAQLEIDTNALEWAVLRAACTHGAVGARDMAFASGLKIAGSELQQRVADLQMDIVGPWTRPALPEPHRGPWNGAALPGGAPLTVPGTASKALFRRASTIYGGANEVQRSIIWRSAFGQ